MVKDARVSALRRRVIERALWAVRLRTRPRTPKDERAAIVIGLRRRLRRGAYGVRTWGSSFQVMGIWPRSGPTVERSRSPVWAWPVAASTAAVGLAAVLRALSPWGNGVVAPLVGDIDAARALLQVAATTVMTAMTLTFSVTVIALQLASQQFSPRLLREFSRDPVTKRVLMILSASFAYAMALLMSLDGAQEVARVAVVAALVLSLGSFGAILAFITHIVRVIRVDTMMLMVHDDTSAAIAQFYPRRGDSSRTPDDLDLDEGAARKLVAGRSGFIQKVNVDALVAVARDHGALVRLDVRPGDHVVEGTPIASSWHESRPADGDVVALAEAVQGAITVAYERSMDQDAAFGFRQLEDIAVKAMSPSINDPVTAAHAVGHMSDLFVRLLRCRLGATVHCDETGASRAIVPDRDLRYYLDLACGQLRRFGANEPTVLVALLRMLRDAATASQDDHQREEIRRSAHLVSAESEQFRAADAESVKDLLERVELALVGSVSESFADRSGATRSI